jgi:hypothetical protein
MDTPVQSSTVRARIIYAALAVGTIVVGLTIHRGAAMLSPRLRDALGDALWAVMMAWWIGALAPAMRPRIRALIALAVCWAVELSQLYHAPSIDGWRNTNIGHLVLGNDFDARDLVAYTAGVACALLLEQLVRVRVNRSSRA